MGGGRVADSSTLILLILHEDGMTKLLVRSIYYVGRRLLDPTAIGLCLSMAALLVGLYLVVRHSIMNEICQHAMGVAVAAAACLDPDDLEKIKGPEDQLLAAYTDVQRKLDDIVRYNPNVRFVWTMRRRRDPDAKPSDYEFIVDLSACDRNSDGLINPDERNEPPGTPYDASDFPALINAWFIPGVDPDIAPDPPYPDLLSGYSPVKNSSGETVAIVGVDITAPTVRYKLFVIRIVFILVGIGIYALLIASIHSYQCQRDARKESKRLSQELVVQNEKLKAILLMREKLSHMIVHDMRNHVFVIMAADELIMVDENITEQQLKQLQIIEKQANRINGFLNDLLLIAKQEHGQLTVNRGDIELKSLFEDVVAKCGVLAQSRNVVVTTRIPETIGFTRLDANLIIRMLDNLLSNAIKFSPANGTVILEVAVISTETDSELTSRRIKFRVIDEGPGINEQDHDRVFESFETVPSEKLNPTQIGLGLALCKLVAEAHDGAISISANNPTGAIFEVDVTG